MQSTSAQIEEMAYYALTDGPQGRQAAEQQWRSFVVSLPIDAYHWFMEHHSQRALLLFMAVLKQEVLEDGLQWTVMEQVAAQLARWMRPDGNFTRSNGEVLEKAVEALLGDYVGGCLKRFFARKGSEQAVGEWLGRGNLHAHFRLYLFYHFIENVSTPDTKMPFVDYRSLCYSFQDSILPPIFDSLIPYFLNFEQAIQLSELTALQESLQLGELGASSGAVDAAVWQEFNKFALVVFRLLEEVVTFRYNISFKEFEGDGYEEMEVCFPEGIIRKMVGSDFLVALYNVIGKLMKMGERTYLSVCLNCLHKILMARTTYLLKDVRAHFMTTNLTGVYGLFLIWRGSHLADPDLAVQIIHCNIKLLAAFKLRELEELSETSQEVAALYMNWILFIRDLPLTVLEFSRTALHVHNQMLLATAELLKEICEYIHIQKMQHYIPSFHQKCAEFTQLFLAYFVGEQHHTLFPDHPPSSIQDYNEPLRRFFSDILLIATADYRSTFDSLLQLARLVYSDPLRSRGAANLLLLLREAISEKTKFLENGILGDDLLQAHFKSLEEEEPAEREELHTLAEVLKLTMDYVSAYCSGDRSDRYLNHCVILFVEKFLCNTIERLAAHEEEAQENATPTSEYVLYVRMRKLQEGVRDEDFIYLCLNILSGFIRCKEFDDFEYIFQSLYEVINKTKLGMRRAYFKETQIYREMLALFVGLTQMELDKDAIKWRALLYKSIAALSFDDVLDSYRINIRETVNMLKKSLRENEFLKVLYDLTGICQSVDNPAVYCFFVTVFTKEINLRVLLDCMFREFRPHPQSLADLLTLTYEMINGRSRRMLSTQISKRVYGMVEAMLPLWNSLLEMAPEMPNSEDVSLELYKILDVLLQQGHVNLALLDHFFGDHFRLFLRLMLSNLTAAHEHIAQYPEYLGPYYTALLHLFSSDVLKALFSNPDAQVVRLLADLVHAVMLQICNCRSVDDAKRLTPDPNSQTVLEIELQLVHNYFKFAYDHQKYLHRRTMCANIASVWEQTPTKASFILAALRCALDFGKQIREGYKHICMTAVIMFRQFNFDLQQIVAELGIRNEKDAAELRRIVAAVRHKEAEEDWLSLQLKDWLKSDLRYVELGGPSGYFEDY